MKKIYLLFATFMVCMSASAQLLQGEGLNENKGGSIGIIGGALGINGLSYAGVGMNGTIYGAYIDFMFLPRANANSTDVNKHSNEKQSISVHLGYQVPLLKWLNIIPIVGYTQVQKGTTDGSNWTYTYGSGINNSFYVDETNKGFEFGGILAVKIGKIVRIYGAGTTRCIYGGIGFKL